MNALVSFDSSTLCEIGRAGVSAPLHSLFDTDALDIDLPISIGAKVYSKRTESAIQLKKHHHQVITFATTYHHVLGLFQCIWYTHALPKQSLEVVGWGLRVPRRFEAESSGYQLNRLVLVESLYYANSAPPGAKHEALEPNKIR